jgi:hypothetical protein
MDNASAPLADYFWIAGVESITYDDGPTATQVDDTIAEDGEGEEAQEASAPRGSARHSRQNSANRLSTISKLSITPSVTDDSRNGEDVDVNTTKSNRSSATIRPASQFNVNGAANSGVNGNPGLFGFGPDGFPPDFDFDKALLKFAAERENFLDDLTFSAGAKTQSRPPMISPRTEKLKAAEEVESGRMSPLMKSLRGSIRRKISFRDMNSARKQPMTPRPGRPDLQTPSRPDGAVLTCLISSLCANIEASQQLQLCYSSARAAQHRSRYAPS